MTRGRITAALGIALVGCAVFPAAGAGRVLVARAFPDRGPALAGLRVLYLESSGTGESLVSAQAGRRPIRLTHVDESGRELAGFAASPQRVAVGSQSISAKTTAFQDNIASAPIGDPRLTTAAAASGDSFIRPYCGPTIDTEHFDVSANAIAYFQGASCASATPKGVVHDFDAGGRTVDLPATGPLRLAGSFVAWVQGADSPTLVVHDWVAGADAYSVSLGNAHVAGLDVQEDGKAVVALGSVAPYALFWTSRSDPTLHPLGQTRTAQPLMSGDRVAALRTAAGRGADLVVVDLTGAASKIASFEDAVILHGYDFDGLRAAWGQWECLGPRIYLETVPAAARAKRAAADCPIHLRSRRLRAGRGGKVAIPFGCPNGCEGELTLRASRISHRKLRRSFALPAGSRRFVFITLPRSARGRLATLGSVQADLTAEVSDNTLGTGTRLRRRITLLTGG